MHESIDAPALSVVIPCLGHARELARCLGALHPQQAAAGGEIVVVDSGGDPEVARVVSLFPGVRLVRGDGVLESGPARNLGVRHARSARLAFLDADCVAEPDWTRAVAATPLESIRIAGGPVLDGRPLHPVAAADHLLSFPDCGPLRPSGPVPHLPGCNLVLSRETFETLGGFSRLPLFAEDTVFALRARARWPAGIRYDRGLRVRHSGRAGLAAFLVHQERLGRARGVLGNSLRPLALRVGHRKGAVPFMALWRLGYVLRRTAEWNAPALPRFVLCLPLLFAGLLAWAAGFRRGRECAREKER
jgi:glycosyltransferase involved in cell wall biosynthesis